MYDQTHSFVLEKLVDTSDITASHFLLLYCILIRLCNWPNHMREICLHTRVSTYVEHLVVLCRCVGLWKLGLRDERIGKSMSLISLWVRRPRSLEKTLHLIVCKYDSRDQWRETELLKARFCGFPVNSFICVGYYPNVNLLVLKVSAREHILITYFCIVCT